MELSKLKEATKSLKVLYVEDSLSARKITSKMLRAFFDHVDEAVDGRIAFEMFKKYQEETNHYYDIVFTDYEMPNMDGQELSKVLMDINPHQEIVVLSGVNDFKMVVELINVGVKKFISKPVKLDELYTVVSQIVANINKKRKEENERLETLEYNEYLKQKEEEHKALIEAKIQELEEFTHALNESAIVSKTDPQGNITYVNDAFCKISGYSVDELIGQNNRMLKSERRVSSYYQKMWNTIKDKKSYKIIFENKRKDGSRYYIESTINPILDINGEIIEFIAVSHDMTQLIASMEVTKLAQKSKEEFFVNMSHEMKTPLNAVIGFSRVLQHRIKDDPKSLMLLETIEQAGNDLSGLVESIIDMRKIQDRSLELVKDFFDAKTVLQACCEQYNEKAKAKELKYEIDIEKSIPDTLFGDSKRVCQVLSTVLDNAVKFTSTGGSVNVSIIYDSFTKHLICSVKDNGIGIAKENQDKIFGLQQLDSSTNRSYEGTGLGLNLAHNLLVLMRGSIKVKSILSKGSLFTIEFPLDIESKS